MEQVSIPIAEFKPIELKELNCYLAEWGHRMGPLNRPMNGQDWGFGLFEHGQCVAVASHSALVRERVAGLGRHEAIELSRLCAYRTTLNRVMLRLWREMVFVPMGIPWAVSYQDKALHTGNIYRFDGWRVIGESRSGTDKRSNRKGRSKKIWGFNREWTP